ncbi:MAG: hypothetical protein P3A28_00135 [Gemmatimonadota bacterium]|nr:hypothetical protein [Gemmatimonadota bacterium]
MSPGVLFVLRRRAALVLLVGVGAVQSVEAQAPLAAANRAWNDTPTLDLVARAIGRRTIQLSDSGLADYRAVAHGYLTFLAQLGEGFPDPPQVVRADELAVEVYWRAPNLSKQRLVGRRDTLVLPTDIAYHRDHLAIVQNNFPAIIRLGDGDEVRDVPHPLSVAGRSAYDYATADSLTIRVGDRSWEVVGVEVRPRDDRLARVIGTLYLDRETAAVVRLALTFTRAALRDPALEDVSVILDNGLVDGRFWLPRRQEIEIRRTGTWLEFPARGVIRGEWDLCCVEVNRGFPAERLAAPELSSASPAELASYRFPGHLADSLAARVQAAGQARPAELLRRRAEELVRREAVRRKAGLRIAAARVSDFIRVNRVEGLALGGGLGAPLPGAATIRASARYGLDDRLAKYRLTLGRRIWSARLAFSVFDEYRDAGVVPEMSGAGNSIAAQEFAADFSDEYRAHGGGLSVSGGSAWRWNAGVDRLRESALRVHATPSRGTYRPALAADPLDGTRAALSLAHASARDDGTAVSVDAMVAGVWSARAARDLLALGPLAGRDSAGGNYVRAVFRASVVRPVQYGTWHLGLIAAGRVRKNGNAQDDVRFGGPITAPGYAARSLRAPAGAVARAEWHVTVGSLPLNLGRFGRTQAPVTLAPFAVGAWRTGITPGEPAHARSVGLGMISAYNLIRLDLARGVDASGGWTIRIDFSRTWWPIL